MKIDKDGNKTVDTTSYKTKFIDSARFMASPVSNLVDNLTGGIHKIKCTKFFFFLKYRCAKSNLIVYECLSYNKWYSKKLNEGQKKKFKSPFKLSNNDINKFFLLLRKDVYPLNI